MKPSEAIENFVNAKMWLRWNPDHAASVQPRARREVVTALNESRKVLQQLDDPVVEAPAAVASSTCPAPHREDCHYRGDCIECEFHSGEVDKRNDDEHVEPTAVKFLCDLADKIWRIPAMYGVDGYHSDRLREIAADLEKESEKLSHNELAAMFRQVCKNEGVDPTPHDNLIYDHAIGHVIHRRGKLESALRKFKDELLLAEGIRDYDNG